jgi:hypothetical protein
MSGQGELFTISREASGRGSNCGPATTQPQDLRFASVGLPYSGVDVLMLLEQRWSKGLLGSLNLQRNSVVLRLCSV